MRAKPALKQSKSSFTGAGDASGPLVTKESPTGLAKTGMKNEYFSVQPKTMDEVNQKAQNEATEQTMRGLSGSHRDFETVASPVGLTEMRSLVPGDLKKVKLTQSQRHLTEPATTYFRRNTSHGPPQQSNATSQKR